MSYYSVLWFSQSRYIICLGMWPSSARLLRGCWNKVVCPLDFTAFFRKKQHNIVRFQFHYHLSLSLTLVICLCCFVVLYYVLVVCRFYRQLLPFFTNGDSTKPEFFFSCKIICSAGHMILCLNKLVTWHKRHFGFISMESLFIIILIDT